MSVEKAKELFLEGYNCSQAVVGAFCQDVGLDFATAIRLASSFGGGMGRMREVCGAVSGIFMLAGLKYGYTSPTDSKAKAQHYKLIQSIAAAFKEQAGSIICRELLNEKKSAVTHVPSDRTEAYYKERPCVRMVVLAAEIAQRVLQGEFETE